MPRLPIRHAVLLALALPCAPASAETLDELDVLSDVAADEAGGIAFAGAQADRGEYLEALSTLERVLGSFPTSSEALLLHATYLCEVDDRQGGRVELQLLRERDYSAGQLRDAQAICNLSDAQAAARSFVAPPPMVPPPPPAQAQAPTNSNNATSSSSDSSNSKPKVN